VLLDIFIADAMAAPFESLSEGHIRAAKHSFDSYFDSRNLLKDNPGKWVKPGLYSSLSLGLLAVAALLRMGKDLAGLASIAFAGKVEKKDLRNPDSVLMKYIGEAVNIPTANYPPVYAAVFSNFTQNCNLSNILTFASSITQVPEIIASSLVASSLAMNKPNTFSDAYAVVQECAKWAKLSQPLLFKIGLNPDVVVNSIDDHLTILLIVKKGDGDKESWLEALSFASKKINRDVVRPTLFPLTLVLYSLCVSLKYREGIFLLKNAISPGGSVRASAILASIFSQVSFSSENPQLLDDLVNKRKAIEICSLVESGKVTESVLDDFIKSEASLTRKETEERCALMKHFKKKNTSKKSKAKKTDELTHHVVESWTKVDKARFKKERQKEIDIDL